MSNGPNRNVGVSLVQTHALVQSLRVGLLMTPCLRRTRAERPAADDDEETPWHARRQR